MQRKIKDAYSEIEKQVMLKYLCTPWTQVYLNVHMLLGSGLADNFEQPSNLHK